MIVQVYVSEISPKKYRGALSSIMGSAYTGGILVALCLNIGFARFCVGWRVAFAIIALTGLFCTVGMLFIPYSPR